MAPTTFYYSIPVMAILILLELKYSLRENNHAYDKKDSGYNILAGIGYFIASVVSKLVIYSLYEILYYFRFMNLGNAWWVWVLAFVSYDLFYYCYHRTAHTVNWFWVSHSVHHSSEHFNLTTAFRMPWTDNLTGQFIFWIWIPLIGVHPFIIMLVSQVALFYQAIIHTEAIHKCHPVIEFIFNTPSHHRVHHSSNPKYLDKNHGGVLIIWDRLFGTFEEEEESPEYGLTTKDQFKNLLDVEFCEWRKLLGKFKQAGSWKQRLNYLIKPPGWSHDGSSKTVKQMRIGM